jgi:hypothetical protein
MFIELVKRVEIRGILRAFLTIRGGIMVMLKAFTFKLLQVHEIFRKNIMWLVRWVRGKSYKDLIKVWSPLFLETWKMSMIT